MANRLCLLLLAVLMLAASLGACGQKGPLYLPQDDKQEAQRR